MRLDGVQFKVAHQRFQLQSVELLFPAFYEIMIEVIDKHPGDNEKYPVDTVGKQPC